MNIKNCHCGMNKKFENCCHRYLNGHTHPPTAELLMRSRYSAYATKNIDYLMSTVLNETMTDFHKNDVLESFEKIRWTGLKILSIRKGEKSDKQGFVEFEATFEENGASKKMYEISEFRKDTKSGQWFYILKHEKKQNESQKII